MADILKGKTVLYVEDNPDVAEIIIMFLRQFTGLAIAYANTLALAQQLAELKDKRGESLWSLVITDADLDDGDGVQFAAGLQALGIKVFVLTGNDQNVRPGIPTLLKPVRRDLLEHTILTQLHLARSVTDPD